MKKKIIFLLGASLLLSISSCDDNPTDKVEERTTKVYLPLLTIKTENGDPILDKEKYLKASFVLQNRDENGKISQTLLDLTTEIRGRGNSTWLMDKKPYRIKLTDKSEILGMPSNKHWALLANYSDKSLIRNTLAFEISRRMGFTYTPRTKHVDLVLNGDSIGNYLLAEHVRVDENRVNITPLKKTSTNITGGYLMEIDIRVTEGPQEDAWFKTQTAGMYIAISDPEVPTSEQKKYITDYIQKIEDIIYGKDGVNIMEELPKYLDLTSFIDYYLLNEMSKNMDGDLRLSTFLYKDVDNKVYFGPAWDYDVAFGNANADGTDKPTGWYVRRAPWYTELFKQPKFDAMVKARWKELRSNKLTNLDAYIDENVKMIDESQKKNFVRWDILGKLIWLNPQIHHTYAGEVSYLKSWLKNRMEWMDKELK